MGNSQSHNKDEDSWSGPIAYMARNPIAANLLMIILLGGGIWTASNIQKEVFPQYQLDIVEVSVVYPGAAPAEVEQGILRPVEEAIRGVQGIKEVVSTAYEGSGEVTIELVAGTDRMKTFQDIDQAVNRIRTFPDDIEEPEVRLQSNQREVMVIGLSMAMWISGRSASWRKTCATDCSARITSRRSKSETCLNMSLILKSPVTAFANTT